MISDSSMSDENIRSSVIGFLSHLTTDELKRVLNDDAKLDEILKDVNKQGNGDRENEKDMLLITTRSLAAYNISMEPELASHKNDIVTKSQEGAELYSKVYEKYEKLLSLLGKNKLDDKLAILKVKTKELEEKSDKVGEQFVDGQIDISEFESQFIPERTLTYLSKVKADKLLEMIQQRGHMESRANHNSYLNMNMNGIPHNIH